MIEWVLVMPSFLSIFLKAFQQRNVTGNKYLPVPFITYGMAFCDVFVIGKVSQLGMTWAAVNGMALGGVGGCLLAMWIHNKVFP